MTATQAESFHLHRVSLAPFQPSASPASIEQAVRAAMAFGEDAFVQFLVRNQLAALWYEALNQADLLASTPVSLAENLRKTYHGAIANYLLQNKLCKEIDMICEAHSIPYAIFKGAHIRECVHPEPALRSAADIDVLIPKNTRDTCISAFKEEGFALEAHPKNISHELSLQRDSTWIDLHWEILRPGRTRVPLTSEMLKRRTRIETTWVLKENDCLFVMLVHPVITEHLNSRHSSLIHLVDLQLWLDSQVVDWESTIELLDRSGLKTAAWCMLTWFEMMMPDSAPQSILSRLEPSPARQRYLRRWIEQGSVSRMANLPFVAQGAFTLAIHDTPGDVFRALGGRIKSQTGRFLESSDSLSESD